MNERLRLAFENLLARGAHPNLHAFENGEFQLQGFESLMSVKSFFDFSSDI
jgi:hypothetical protein